MRVAPIVLGILFAWLELAGIGHAFWRHGVGDGFKALIFPPLAWYRSVEIFTHDGPGTVPSQKISTMHRQAEADLDWTFRYGLLLAYLEGIGSRRFDFEYLSQREQKVTATVFLDKQHAICLSIDMPEATTGDSTSDAAMGKLVFKDADVDEKPDEVLIERPGQPARRFTNLAQLRNGEALQQVWRQSLDEAMKQAPLDQLVTGQ